MSEQCRRLGALAPAFCNQARIDSERRRLAQTRARARALMPGLINGAGEPRLMGVISAGFMAFDSKLDPFSSWRSPYRGTPWAAGDDRETNDY